MAAVDPATNHKEFDLLAGHELGQSTAFPKYNEEDPDALNVLVWHKLETEGYHPAAREVSNMLLLLMYPLVGAPLFIPDCF